MALLIIDGSTEINAANLNKLVGAGDGTILGMNIYLMNLTLEFDGVNYRYKLATRDNELSGSVYLGNLGPTNVIPYTNVGDSNITKVSTGKYTINLSSVSKIFAAVFETYTNDSNLVMFTALGVVGTNKVTVELYNASGAYADIASGKFAEMKIFILAKT